MSSLDQAWEPIFVTAGATTTETAAVNSSYTYTAANLTLSPGVWFVSGQMGVIVVNYTAIDDSSAVLYNQTAGANVSGSTGPLNSVNNTLQLSLRTTPVQISLSQSTTFRMRVQFDQTQGITAQLQVASGGASGYAAVMSAYRLG